MKRVSVAVSPVIAIDRGAGRPIHYQIYDGYRAAILNGNLRPAQQIPSTRALSAELGISRIPVLEAYEQLIAEGYFEARPGSGTFVSSSLPSPEASHNRKTDAPHREKPAARGSVSTDRAISHRVAGLRARDHQPWMFGSGAFSIGQLAFDHFPFRVWTRLLARHCRKVNASSMNYGDPRGSPEFREIITAYLRTSRAVRCDPRQILVVSGSQQALDICCRALLDPGDPVWVEDPGYNLLHSALALGGCRLAPIPVDRDGLNVTAGIRECRNAKAAWVTPSHQYPLGVTMSASRRFQLLEWARSAGAWILEDDYDSEYRYESMPIASLQGLDQHARVIYIGTFSKTLFPSLRLGYMVVPHDLVDQFASVRRAMDVCPPPLYQAVLTDFVREGHYARHLRKMQVLYAERRTVLVESIRKEFGSRVDISGDAAGMHLTVIATEDSWNDQEIAERAASQKIWISPLSIAYRGENRKQGFILGFGSTPSAEIPEAIRRIASLC